MRLTLLVVAALASCRREASEPASCPPPAAVAAIHASAFYFQHGPAEMGAARLKEAQSLIGEAPQASRTVTILSQLIGLSRLDASAVDERVRGAETIRALFADWQCLPDDVHEALHTALPALPGERPRTQNAP